MAMSGVELDVECKEAYDAMNMKQTYRYVTFKITDGKIVIDKRGDPANTYEDFLQDLMQKDGDEDDCRYAIYDFKYVVKSQGTEPSARSRIILASWCPDTSRIKKKMLYSASFDGVKKAFKGITTVIQANGVDDIDEKTVEEKIVSSARV